MPRQREKPAIVLDFDRVLFDTEGYIYGLRDAVREHGVSHEDWNQAYAQRGRAELFRLPEMAERLSLVSHRPAPLLLEAMEQETAESLWYLYADSRPFLERFARAGNLFLLTYGDVSLQSEKIRVTGISDFFEAIQIVGAPKAETERLPLSPLQRVVFINDNLREMLELGQRYRWAQQIHLCRPPVEPSQTDSRIPVCQNLAEAETLVDSLLDIQPVNDGSDQVADHRSQGPDHKELRRAFGQ